LPLRVPASCPLRRAAASLAAVTLLSLDFRAGLCRNSLGMRNLARLLSYASRGRPQLCKAETMLYAECLTRHCFNGIPTNRSYSTFAGVLAGFA
jgi:hypothetical protein